MRSSCDFPLAWQRRVHGFSLQFGDTLDLALSWEWFAKLYPFGVADELVSLSLYDIGSEIEAYGGLSQHFV